MASEEHLQHSNFVKSVHKWLRDATTTVGFHEAWKQHCNNKKSLNEYATAMKTLATKCWEENHSKSDKLLSRIEWIYNCIDEYFFKSGYLHYRMKEDEILCKINFTKCVNTSSYGCCHMLNVLDVGSCYNPFKVFSNLNVLGIDIAPATSEVVLCDFLSVSIHDCNESWENDRLLSLKQSSFDVVIFSLLLEYFPSPIQRLHCCKNAYKLLKSEGLLFIITPDSNHVGKNAKIMKSWRYILAELGFSRIKYTKLQYLHCMAFRKNIYSETAQRWTQFQDSTQFFSEMFIPQDLTNRNILRK